MNDVILKSILETSIECDKMIDDFFYLEKCKYNKEMQTLIL